MDHLDPDRRAGSGDPIRRVLAHHERTKHHLHRYARGPGRLDWANQPDPFRTYAGAPAVDLPLLADGLATAYADLKVPGAVAPHPPGREGIALLFELALGLSAWKQYQGERWALRCNPSSGNLHPTEGYAILPELPGLPAGVYHYVSRDHRLERRCSLEGAGTDQLIRSVPRGTFLVGLTTITWREAWKYGERAFRYGQLDAGHALAAVRYAAAALGWSAVLLDGLADADLATWLGLDRDDEGVGLESADRERPAAALLVGPPSFHPAVDVRRLVEVLRGGTWTGRANPLSPVHIAWEVIDDVAGATWKPDPAPFGAAAMPSLPPLPPAVRVPAATLIRRRRSCLALDGRTSIAAETFYAILDHLLPRPGVPPWDMLPWRPNLHLGLFVHRVRGLPPGLYLFERSEAVHDRLHASLRDGSLWRRPAGCPDHLRLFLLAERDLRDVSRIVSCHQAIAADGAFSLGMLADFGATIRGQGPWWYRHLHWEAGVLGQVLYLEAEAAGVRGTGIGCYFDDAVHELLGLAGDRFQDLYHFTVGGPVDDPRLTTLAPYPDRARFSAPVRVRSE
ncbi:MAG TPA: SagB/ThcOx family dehydrogenase [Isosphaeraceae bacterium]|nr:SagB/ThcOx family dehydrogenase [Isosphaeraceae bacterium]